jgi:hypothetical protein
VSQPTLVAPRVEAPVEATAGIWIIEDLQGIENGIKDGSWIETTLGVVGASLDTLALVSDPAGALLQYGISWLIEHIRPLREALDALAGDAAQIQAHAQTWRNVAAQMTQAATDLETAVKRDLAEWAGEVSDRYRAWAAGEKNALDGVAKACNTMATITVAAGMLVAAVRLLIRDAIATVVSRLIVYAAELIASFGLLTPWVYEQATTLISSWTARIAKWMRGLAQSIARLRASVARVMELIRELRKILGRLRERALPGSRNMSASSHTKPIKPPDPTHAPRGTRTDAHPTRKKDRGLRRENESADEAAKAGYDVEQNPPPRPNGKKPDMDIQGENFDAYAPETGKLQTIRDEISGKVKEGQTERVILNLNDCPRTLEEIKDILTRKPVPGLKEILVVKDGKVIPFFPFDPPPTP